MKTRLIGTWASLLVVAACAVGSSVTGCADAASADEQGESVDEQNLRTDAQVRTAIESAARGAYYTDRGVSHPFSYVFAALGGERRSRVTEQLVREKMAPYVDDSLDSIDKPLAGLKVMEESWTEWKARACSSGERELCTKLKKLNEVLEANLRGLRVFYFGSEGGHGIVTGVAISMFIVGVTPKNNLAGVRATPVWGGN